MTSALQPVAQRYNQLDTDSRYKFRRLLRSLVKWYGYIAQIVRMYDSDMHKEYTFCAYLLKLIPNEPVDMIDLEGKLKLEYYKLKETFKGKIELDPNQGGEYEPVTGRVPVPLNPKSRWMRLLTRSTKNTKASSPKGTKCC